MHRTAHRNVRSPREHAQVLGKRARAWRSDPEGSLFAVADLAELAQRGDTLATSELLRAHTPHVRGLCWRLRVRRMDLDDYVQEGLVAMLTPIQRYDRARGVPLWFYARPYVKGHLIGALGRQAGLTAHQARHYKAVWHGYDAVVEASGVVTATAIWEALRAGGRRGVGMETIEAVLESGTRRTGTLSQRTA